MPAVRLTLQRPGNPAVWVPATAERSRTGAQPSVFVRLRFPSVGSRDPRALIWKSVAEKAFHASGALRLVRGRSSGALRILMYHRFSDTLAAREQLDRQCRHLRRFYHPLTLTDAAAILRKGDRLPPNSLALTIDDGYADARIAGEVFRQHGLRATLYVVSGFLDRELWLWPDIVEYCCENTRRETAGIPIPGAAPLSLSFHNPTERRASDSALDQALLVLPDALRLQVIRDLPEQLGVRLPAALPQRYEPLAWSALDALRDVFEAGAHTQTHPILSRISDPGALRSEIAGSRTRIEAALGQPVRHFCYPNGTPADYDQRTIDIVRELGFETAVTTIDGSNPPGCGLYELRRTGAEPDHSQLYYERRVAGWG